MYDKKIVDLFKVKFPDHKIDSLVRVDLWYIFSVVEEPIDYIDGLPIYSDFFIGYDLKKKRWEFLNSDDMENLGIWNKYCNAPKIPFE